MPLTAAVLRRTPCISITLCRWFCEESVRMTLLEIFLIGIGLSMDAFAVAICKGLAMPDKVHKRSAFLIALYFGVFQAVMPTLGWLLGSQFAHYVTRFAPWIAFVLLAWIGGNMIRESRAEEQAKDFGHSVKREMAFLTVHGMLHLLGYDHMEEEERLEMEREQRFVMEKLGIPRE